MAKDSTIINFKETEHLKTAIRIAAAKEGHANSSQMISSVLRKNKAIKEELEKLEKDGDKK